MNYNKSLKKIEEYVNLLYAENNDPRLVYHSFARIKEVVTAALKIADYYQVDERARFVICAALWFEWGGFVVTKADLHTEKSVELANKCSAVIGIDPEEMLEIEKCIRTLGGEKKPDSLSEKIACDSELFFQQPAEFREKSKLLKKETEALQNKKINGSEWRLQRIKMLETHVYYTDYCKSLLNKVKAEFLEGLRIKQKEKLAESANLAIAATSPGAIPQPNVATELIVNEELASKKRPKRGVETMFRISSINSMRISEMADTKAHIMITVNTIIISAVLGLLVKNLDENRALIIPTILLLAVNVTVIIYAVLATRPTVTKGVFTREQVEDRSVNLIFFGNFYKMNFEDYDFGVTEMMEDRDFLYRSLRKDIYAQGKVLGKKYKLLHASYSVFMYGILASVVAFAIAVLVKISV